MSYWTHQYGDPETVENIDYEKKTPPVYAKYFEETSSPQQVVKQESPEEEPAYAKYFQEEPKKRKDLAENPILRGIAIPAETAIKGAISLPHEIADLANSLLGLAGRGGGYVEEFANLFPSYEQLTKKAEEKGLHTEPRGFGEAAGEKFYKFLSQSPAFGGIGGGKGLIGLAGAATGAEAGERASENLPPWAAVPLSVVSTVAGDVAARRLTGGLVNSYKALTNFKNAFAESFMFRHKPNEKMKQAIEAFERQNIQPPLTSVTKAPVAKFLEKEASLNPMTEEVFEQFKDNLSNEMIGLFDKALDEGSKTKIPTREEAHARLQSGAKAQRDLKRQAVSDAYSKAKQSLPPDAKISTEGSFKIKEKGEELRDGIKTLLESGEDIALKEKAGELLKNIENLRYEKTFPYDELTANAKKYFPSKGRIDRNQIDALFDFVKEAYPDISKDSESLKASILKKRPKGPTKKELIGDIENFASKQSGIPIDFLEGTNKSINSMLDYEVQGGLKNRLREIQKTIEQQLDEYAKTNPKYKEYRDFAKKEHGQIAQLYRNDLGQAILYGQRPEQTLKAMSTPSGIKQVEQILGKNSELMNSLKRHKLEEWLTDKMILSDEFRIGGTKAFESQRNQELFNSLTSPAQREYFKDLATIDKSIKRGISKYLNTSGTENTRQQLGNWMSLLVEPFVAIAQGRPISALLAPLTPLAKGRLAKYATDPEFINLVKNLQIQSNRSNRKSFMSGAQELLGYLDNKSKEKES